MTAAAYPGRRALVLGGGGIAGVAWESALISALADLGVDLSDADVIVGTSAGSIVGSVLLSTDLATWMAAQVIPEGSSAIPDAADIDAFYTDAEAVARGASDHQSARAAVGRLASATSAPGGGADAVARFAQLLPTGTWPDADFRVIAVDAADGSLAVFDAVSGVTLPEAVAASCAVPGVFPVVQIADREFMDGGARSPTNADVAADCDTVLVLACGPEPAASPLGPTLIEAVHTLRKTARVLVIEADAVSLAAFGPDTLAVSSREPAARAGARQAGIVATAVREFWTASPGSPDRLMESSGAVRP